MNSDLKERRKDVNKPRPRPKVYQPTPPKKDSAGWGAGTVVVMHLLWCGYFIVDPMDSPGSSWAAVPFGVLPVVQLAYVIPLAIGGLATKRKRFTAGVLLGAATSLIIAPALCGADEAYGMQFWEFFGH
ncbi:hypothetical protein OAU50_03070 [Planctomycetota bacterium]|nr:hypothetical protein [Planctomycetota bacterium]